MAHSQIAPIDWLTHVNESHRASEQIRSEARRLLVGRFVRSVEEKVEQGEWTAEALVRSKSRERTFYQVRTKFCVSVGTTTILEHVCSCMLPSDCSALRSRVTLVSVLCTCFRSTSSTSPILDRVFLFFKRVDEVELVCDSGVAATATSSARAGRRRFSLRRCDLFGGAAANEGRPWVSVCGANHAQQMRTCFWSLRCANTAGSFGKAARRASKRAAETS